MNYPNIHVVRLKPSDSLLRTALSVSREQKTASSTLLTSFLWLQRTLVRVGILAQASHAGVCLIKYCNTNASCLDRLWIVLISTRRFKRSTMCICYNKQTRQKQRKLL